MMITRVLVLGLALMTVACGYHLRGAIELPEQMRKVYLKNASQSLQEQFTKTLKASSVDVVKEISQAGLVVAVFNEQMDRRVLSLSSTGKANEFELNYSLDYELQDASGAVLKKIQSIEITREYYNDQEAIIAKTNEETIIQQELYLQAVKKIVNTTRSDLAGK
ncbi:LPS assembly lipoprotein LptE [Methylicorpusculum oleiharenae]|uniref:LPS-assembly lipoprotein LptE n=1 Tax=Methylicorpusculum oleiharenae TaxID=1338687 RepID=UPI001E422C3E|nr:LPS assembly lipoprotein LptE [Methylicorpusculum oleiharenae]MCD2449328.1 LPS assembly lipoprotein LptE [Methylicorpusculum oleiharenae]